MFGFDGLSNLAKGIIKIAIVGAAIWTQLWPARGTIGNVLDGSAGDVASDMSHLLFKVLIAALAALAVIAAGDYFLQRYRFLQRNRMSKQEIKEEFRQSEGDPAVKAKIRQLRMERSRRRMIAAVPEATVIITNPTHYAVALKYESGKMAAPICVAKGVDALALRIREVAAAHDVPIVENVALARALHATVEIDEAIPAEHYKAVAQIIGYVMRLEREDADELASAVGCPRLRATQVTAQTKSSSPGPPDRAKRDRRTCFTSGRPTATSAPVSVGRPHKAGDDGVWVGECAEPTWVARSRGP